MSGKLTELDKILNLIVIDVGVMYRADRSSNTAELLML